jgi:Tfp pilus assembly protein PilN
MHPGKHNMSYSKNEGTTAVALFVDGFDVKFVHLAMKNKTIALHDFRTVTLGRKLEETGGLELGSPGVLEISDTSLDTPLMQEGLAEGMETETNSSVIVSLLNEFPAGRYKLVYSVSEPSVYYQTLDDTFQARGEKLNKKILEELAKIRSERPQADQIASVPAADGQVLAIVREDGLSLLHLIESVKDFIGKRIPQIPFIETSDISLMNMVRANYELSEEEVSLVVYVGSEFSRLIFMKGGEFYHFAPAISEGRSTPNIENTIYSRILLEQDSAGIQRIDRIFLAGESHKVGLKLFLGPQFSNAPIEYLNSGELDTGELQESVTEIVSEYAIPISAAMRALDKKKTDYLNIDLLPNSFREGQKVFKLAWHGYLLLALIFFSTLFFTMRTISMNERVKQANNELSLKRMQLAENQRLQTILDSLGRENQRYLGALATYDAVVPNYNRWSKTLYRLTNSIDDIKSFWITSLAQKPDSSIDLGGISMSRGRIPRISNIFEQGALQSVQVDSIRGQEVYKFLVNVRKPESEK